MADDQAVYYRIRNWDRYQVFGDGRQMRYFAVQVEDDLKRGRRGLQNDEAFALLNPTMKLQLLSCFVLAARTENHIPDRGKYVEYHNFSDQPFDLKALVNAGFMEKVEKSVQARTETPLDLEGERETEANASVVEKSDFVRTVYDCWRAERGKTHGRFATMSENRRTKIKARLREFSVDELCEAIRGVALDPWEERPRHDDLTQIFRTRETAERFLGFVDKRESRTPPCLECGVGGGQHLSECEAA